MILIDTSVWIEVFKSKSPINLEALVSFDEIATCLPVIQEVLQGFRDERVYRRAKDSMLAMQIVESPLRVELYEEAALIYRSARRAGVTIRSSVDCLIAACAVRNGLEVLHRDRDFTALATILPLRERRI